MTLAAYTRREADTSRVATHKSTLDFRLTCLVCYKFGVLPSKIIQNRLEAGGLAGSEIQFLN